jgi:KDO2-lipid IV(A) lauroyltransferase
VRGVVICVDCLPLRVASWIAERLADVVFLVDRQRRRVAVENIQRAGVRADGESSDRLARASMRHFAAVLVETLKAERLLGGARWRESISFRIPAEVQQLLDNPRAGLLAVTGHFGNWEIGAQAVSRLKPVVAAARRVSNPYLDRLLLRRKPTRDFRLVPEWFGLPTRFTGALRNGEILALLIDVDARGEGIKLDFFGRPAATHVTAAMLHLVTKVPIVFVSCRRLRPGRFEVAMSALIERRPTGDKEADVREILGRLNGELEAAIREDPAQYLWAHSRWKYGEWEPPPGFVPLSGRLGGNDRVG